MSETYSEIQPSAPVVGVSTQILQAADVDFQTVTRLYDSEHKKWVQLQQELHALTQNLMSTQDTTKYWQDKWVQLKIELGLANYELAQLRGEKKSKDAEQVKDMTQKLQEMEDRQKHLVEAHKYELEQKQKEMDELLKRKDEIIERVKEVVDRLNVRLDEQKTEDKIMENILALDDRNSMIRFVYTAQYKVNQKIISDIAKGRKGSDKSDGTSSTSSNEDLTTPIPMQQQPMFMGMNPMMFPNPPMQFGPFPMFPPSNFPINKTEPKVEDTEKKIERED